jgi:hypothetical protein
MFCLDNFVYYESTFGSAGRKCIISSLVFYYRWVLGGESK